MELYQLKSFITIARLKNLTQSARELNISQSAMSVHIKKLEEELQVKLFTRKPSGMALTETGSKLLTYAVRILDSTDEFMNKAVDLKTDKELSLTIGINTISLQFDIGQLNNSLMEKFPNRSINYISVESAQVCDHLQKQTIDIGFIYGDIYDPEFHYQLITHTPLCIVIPKNVAAKINDWKELVELPFIWTADNCPFHSILSLRLDKLKLKFRNIKHSADEVSAIEFVQQGFGVGITSKETAQKIVSSGRATIWDKETFKIPFGITCLKSRISEKKIETIVQAIVSMLSDKGINKVNR